MNKTEQHSRLHEVLEDLLQLARSERSEGTTPDRQKPAQD